MADIVPCRWLDLALLTKINAAPLHLPQDACLLITFVAPMTPTLIQARLHAELTQMRERLLERIEQQRGGKVSRADVAYAHFDHLQDDDGQRNNERDVEFAINENETAQLEDIGQALQRISDKVYGLCTDCGMHIPDERLQAAPLALRCVVCQSAFEKQHATL